MQVFGTGLEGKGIQVEVQDNGFACTSQWTTVKKRANFVDGKAEVPLRLYADEWKLCMVALQVWVTLPYACTSLSRVVHNVSWGLLSPQQGSCRALQQKCGATVSDAAVPYIDMWCRRPPGQFNGGNAEEMDISWFPIPSDGC